MVAMMVSQLVLRKNASDVLVLPALLLLSDGAPRARRMVTFCMQGGLSALGMRWVTCCMPCFLVVVSTEAPNRFMNG